MSSTTERALTLLGLLQSRPVWGGPELAERLGVTTRSIRRDVERLRELGYPVLAAHGSGGGYQLGRGRALPPLLLDDQEAIATALSLRLAAGGTVAGASEAALRALSKLDQVLPARLREQVRAVQGAVTTLERGSGGPGGPGGSGDGGPAELVDADVLLELARACRDHVRCDLDYTARDGARSRRRVEPYRLVATGRRWYLLAWDLDRQDWRTLRLDRVDEVAAGTWRFEPRSAPDAASYVSRSISTAPYRWETTTRVHAPLERVREQVSPSVALVEPDPDGTGRTCLVTTGGDQLVTIAVHLLLLGHELEVLGPPELREELARLGERAARAACAPAVRTLSASPGGPVVTGPDPR